MATKKKIMASPEAKIYKKIKAGIKYNEAAHCELLIKVITDPDRGTMTAFCKEAMIGDTTFYRWLNQYETFYECYRYAIMSAKFEWEQEAVLNRDNDEFNLKAWSAIGNSRFSTSGKPKVILNVNEQDNPYQQYQSLIKQAARGDYTSDELKQVMECLNSGTRVYEVFKVQKEIDELKSDVKEMGGYHGHNNIVPITGA